VSHRGSWELTFCTGLYLVIIFELCFALILDTGIFIWQSDVVLKVGSKNPILETLKALLDRAAPLLVDEQCIKELFKLVKDAVEGLSDDGDDEYEWHESSGSSPVGKTGLALLLVSLSFQSLLHACQMAIFYRIKDFRARSNFFCLSNHCCMHAKWPYFIGSRILEPDPI